MNYSDIIRKSIETIKNNYWLLIYGIVVGGLGKNISSNTNWDEDAGSQVQNEISKIINSSDPQAALKGSAKVLGTATNSFVAWFDSVPDYKWVLLVLAVVVSIIIATAVGLVMMSWAYGGMLKGIDMAHRGEKVTLLNTSVYGLEHLKEVVKLIVYRGVISLASFMVLAFPVLVIFLVNQSAYISAGVYAVFAAILFILVSIAIHFSFLYAVRQVVFAKQAYFPAFKSGFVLFKSNLRDTFVTSLINGGFGFIVGIVLTLVALPAGLIFVGQSTPGVMHMFVAAWIVLLGIFVAIVVNAAMAVFIQSNWNQVYFKLNNNAKN